MYAYEYWSIFISKLVEVECSHEYLQVQFTVDYEYSKYLPLLNNLPYDMRQTHCTIPNDIVY